MEGGGDDVFVINNTEEGQTEEVPVAHTEETAKETEAEAMEHVKGLVPLCAQHLNGPQLSSATFGYDIAQMAKRPWAEPGAKLSDYFNYGFNEQSWRVYCALQKNGEESLLAKAGEMLQKLEATGRPSGGVGVGGGGSGEEMGAAGADPSTMMMMMGQQHNNGGNNNAGAPMDGYGANPYGGNYGGEMAMMHRGGYSGGGRPFQQRDYHGGFGGANNTNYKTRLCKPFAEGHCNRGDSCNYAHGVAELRQPGGGDVAPLQQDQQQQQQQQSGSNYGGATFYQGGAAPPAPERTANYLMPPFQAGAALPPMMQSAMTMAPDSGEGASGFRQPPKRQRHEGGGVYEPQY
ncbi:hypothetical protein ABB37_04217 [Leptomonas pyrrhocoris]|uniref:C3H1-type domain-containing protein n=1 Tax=Leptomonas pyrrhocoris TaxID=157538 RepID=A0A0N0DVS8_LEPPY|nr:hypothetical protein ABB37_04217 [Leptomonas pyrrhocoris]XP_015659207.1 hypothetical protein ABB37_04217 [Leptomonas pyrrhocoris]KPA80767.1 hypothetical protein ABB37_04217 [Leptomonas pyrrhocoris]KPA80768.1 hypothetical protein ABB37_04217 [Leptomonas pyrrhocoris]|eukprot:XP_015659206.1 hypothetical protein ABB37_04217 [Leptomonas pyrrhocoris]